MCFFFYFEKADKFRFNDSYPYILPKSYDDKELFDSSMLFSILGDEKKPIRVDAQCVRSVSPWSCGTRTIEHSIQNAYIHMIDSAQHFIYIEVRLSTFKFFEKEKKSILESIFYFNCWRFNS